VPGIGGFFLGGDGDDQQDALPLFPGQLAGQDIVDPVLALHAMHASESLGRNDPDDPVIVAEFHLVWGRKALLQNLLELPDYRHWGIPWIVGPPLGGKWRSAV